MLSSCLLTQKMVGAKAAQRRGHPVDGNAEQLHGHLGVHRFCSIAQVAVVAHTIKQDICHLQNEG